MTKKGMFQKMGITATTDRLKMRKEEVERFYLYWLKKENKELARKFILQFLPR